MALTFKRQCDNKAPKLKLPPKPMNLWEWVWNMEVHMPDSTFICHIRPQSSRYTQHLKHDTYILHHSFSRMSFNPQQTPLFNVGHFESELDEENCLHQFSRCPGCHQEYGVALILPCSHIMCVRCVEAEAGRRSQLGLKVVQNACTLLCHCCRGPIELPCWSWTSATCCLPQYLNRGSQSITEEGGVSSDQTVQVRVSPDC